MRKDSCRQICFQVLKQTAVQLEGLLAKRFLSARFSSASQFFPLYRDNGKEHGNYRDYRGYIGIAVAFQVLDLSSMGFHHSRVNNRKS